MFIHDALLAIFGDLLQLPSKVSPQSQKRAFSDDVQCTENHVDACIPPPHLTTFWCYSFNDVG
jgi:hypothetical protein